MSEVAAGLLKTSGWCGKHPENGFFLPSCSPDERGAWNLLCGPNGPQRRKAQAEGWSVVPVTVKEQSHA